MKVMKQPGVLAAAMLMLTGFGFDAAQLRWDPGKYGSIRQENGRNILRVSVPGEDLEKNPRLSAQAQATLDLRQFPVGALSFSISIRANDVSRPQHSYNGVKFMLHYVDAMKQDHWHNIGGWHGSFDWKNTGFSAAVIGGVSSGVLSLGLQESSGTVDFDLDSLKIVPLFRRMEDPFQAQYTKRTTALPRLRGVMSPQRDLTRDDLETLAKWKVNLIRFQLCRNWGAKFANSDLADYDRWLDSRLENLEWTLKQAPRHGFKVVIDLHTPAGGRNQDDDLVMFYDRKYADHFIQCWKKIAARFKGDPGVWGYDLVNEPAQSAKGLTDYRSIQLQAAEEIRKIDPVTPIIVAPDQNGGIDGFAYLNPLPLRDVIYEVHIYAPFEFTHQKYNAPKPTVYPGRIGGCFWNKEALRLAMAPVRDFQRRYGAHIYVGEFSAIAWAPGAAQYLTDCISLFEEYGWNWSYHAFREFDGWSVEHQAVEKNRLAPSDDNDRKRALLEGFRKNSR